MTGICGSLYWVQGVASCPNFVYFLSTYACIYIIVMCLFAIHSRSIKKRPSITCPCGEPRKGNSGRCGACGRDLRRLIIEKSRAQQEIAQKHGRKIKDKNMNRIFDSIKWNVSWTWVRVVRVSMLCRYSIWGGAKKNWDVQGRCTNWKVCIMVPKYCMHNLRSICEV